MGSLHDYLQAHRESVYPLLRKYINLGKPFLLRSDLLDVFKEYCDENDGGDLSESSLANTIAIAQEAAIEAPWIYMAIRPYKSVWNYLRFHVESMEHEEIQETDYLRFKEHIVKSDQKADEWILEVDLGPFNREFPKLKEARSIGRGVEFLNKHLSSELFDDVGKGNLKLLEFLRVHQFRGQQLMLNARVQSIDELRQSLRFSEEYLKSQNVELTWKQVAFQLQAFGLEPGWGATVERMLETIYLLVDLLEAPDPVILENFLSRIPMIFSLVVLSPHGYFGQSNVLGLPDTGGQVVYILDQVRALEKEMRQRLLEQGLDIQPKIIVVTRLIPEARNTTCNQREEKIIGTQNAKILRVPFKTLNGEIVSQWISRFEVWPYLERFAIDVQKEILCDLEGRPDLIVGNYSDGSLVASILAHNLKVTQCNIAHALEKAKYVFSDLYWQENDDKYHFACQYTADLISMNAADFIITSTYQEITGRDDSVGQYESYKSFTLPGLYRVVNGIDLYDPKFNIVSPGANNDIYFSYENKAKRLSGLESEITSLIYNESDKNTRGVIKNFDKRMIFTMARLDRIKNISGFVEWYGENKELQERANLLIIAGHVNLADSMDREEQEEIKKMHRLMDKYQLDDKVRWVGKHLEKNMTGELYRYIADMKGIFIQPALFEAFGLTVIEAMACGLPTFATQYGGPLEIIVDGVSGFHIDPNHGDECAKVIMRFFDQCDKDEGYWEKLSAASIERVESHYTWKLYAERMMTLSRVYGFWKYVTNLERDETRRYLEMFYGLQYRKLASKMETPNQGS